ncbi:MAG TPA: kelch repeat-containing protein [Actinomycetota bacterium]|nr:kelch repeat-containing protein [Actinomycetota bacterium]
MSATLLPTVMPAARYRTLGAAVGGDLYLLGGLDPGGVSSADIFRIDPASGAVAVAGHLATPTHGGAAVTVGNQVLVFGGADVSPNDLVQSFDPATGATSVIGHMPSARADLVGVLVGGQVVLLGGFNGSTFVTDVWTTADGTTFSVLGQVAQPERYPAVAVVGTTIYLFGGLVAGGEYNGTESTAVQSFDVATGRGAVIGHLPEPLAHARAATVGGQVLVFGGWTSAGASAAVWRFDPATGAVTPVGTLPEAVADEAIGVVGGTVYFASGLGAAERPLTAIGSLRLGP